MAAAVVRASTGHGAGPTLATAESGIKLNRSDDEATTSPIPIPTTNPYCNYSWIKPLCLEVTTAGTTNISNRCIYQASTPTTGLKYHWMNQPTYRQPASGNMPAGTGTRGATPASYTAMTGSAAQWDNTSVSTASTGRSGNFVEVVLGVDDNNSGGYTGGAGTAITLPNVLLQYDEA